MILKTQRNPPGCSTLLPVTQESRFSVCSTTPIIKAQWRRKDSAEGGHKETSLAAYYTEIASDLSILLGLSPETSDWLTKSTKHSLSTSPPSSPNDTTTIFRNHKLWISIEFYLRAALAKRRNLVEPMNILIWIFGNGVSQACVLCQTTYRGNGHLVLESPVQSGLLPIFGKTETKTGL